MTNTLKEMGLAIERAGEIERENARLVEELTAERARVKELEGKLFTVYAMADKARARAEVTGRREAWTSEFLNWCYSQNVTIKFRKKLDGRCVLNVMPRRKRTVTGSARDDVWNMTFDKFHEAHCKFDEHAGAAHERRQKQADQREKHRKRDERRREKAKAEREAKREATAAEEPPPVADAAADAAAQEEWERKELEAYKALKREEGLRVREREGDQPNGQREHEAPEEAGGGSGS